MSLGAKSLLDSYALGLSASEYFFSIVDPLPAIAYGNPFYQHSAAFFDVPPYMPLGEIPGEATVSVYVELPAYLVQCVAS